MREDAEKPLRSRALKISRAAADWSQGRLAAEAEITPQTLSDYERGKYEPSLETLYRLAGCMRLSRAWVDDLLALLTQAGRPEGELPAEVPPRIETYARAARPLAEGYLRRRLTGFVAELEASVERRLDAELWERLARYEAAERLALVELGARFRRPGLCLRACEESRKAAAEPEGALDLARLAVRIAELAPLGEADSLRLQGYAGFFLGHALGRKGDLPAAEAAFARARRLWEEGAASTLPLDEGRLRKLEAALRRARRQTA